MVIAAGPRGTLLQMLWIEAFAMPPAAVAMLESSAWLVVAAATVLGVLRPSMRLLLLMPFLWGLLQSLLGSLFGTAAYAELTVLSQAARYMAPLGLLLLLLHLDGEGDRRRTAEWCLRVGLSLTFAFHGLRALIGAEQFIPLLELSAVNVLGIEPRQGDIRLLLGVIGAVDVAAAVALLIRPWAPVLLWMAFWGVVTGASRMTAGGWVELPELLLRAAHYMAPLALLVLVRQPAGAVNRPPEPPGATAGPHEAPAQGPQ